MMDESEKIAAVKKRQMKDYNMWKDWKSSWDKYQETGKDDDKEEEENKFIALTNQMRPIIRMEPLKWKSGNIPQSVMMAEAVKHFRTAAENYDPHRGAAFGTHVANQLQQVRRLGYQYSDILYRPENRETKVKLFLDTVKSLTEKFNRPPTEYELADDLKWSVADVTRMQNESRSSLVAEQSLISGSVTEEDPNYGKMELYYFSLSPEDKKIYDWVTGSHNQPELGVPEIAKRLNMTTDKVYERRRKLGEDMARFIK